MSKELFKYQALFDSNMLGVTATDFNDTIISANDAFLSMVGYTKEDVANGTLRWSVISPTKYDATDQLKVKELLTLKTIIPFEKEYIHKDGHVVPVLVGAETLSNDLSFGASFALDISNLKESERRKDDFAAFVSHELRTPLSVMKLSADMLHVLISQDGDKNELLETTDQINEQIDKLAALISDLLSMARYQGNESAFTLSAIDIHENLLRIAQELSSINNRNVLFEGEKNLLVMANADRLSQVVVNLVNNAVRYSKDGTDIHIELSSDEKCAYIRVKDHGIGISEENLKKIFDRYYRINHADDYSLNGTGIGLFICNEIIKQHGGGISVESELTKGSTFTISLPIIGT